jgi:hypothetical protein
LLVRFTRIRTSGVDEKESISVTFFPPSGACRIRGTSKTFGGPGGLEAEAAGWVWQRRGGTPTHGDYSGLRTVVHALAKPPKSAPARKPRALRSGAPARTAQPGRRDMLRLARHALPAKRTSAKPADRGVGRRQGVGDFWAGGKVSSRISGESWRFRWGLKFWTPPRWNARPRPGICVSRTKHCVRACARAGSRDGSPTRGRGCPRVPDPLGAGVGVKSHPWVHPHPHP